MPATNSTFWLNKFLRTMKRDRKALKDLEQMGWATTVIWECQLKCGINRVIELLARIAKSDQTNTLDTSHLPR